MSIVASLYLFIVTTNTIFIVAHGASAWNIFVEILSYRLILRLIECLKAKK
jgi:hypothetical protein